MWLTEFVVISNWIEFNVNPISVSGMKVKLTDWKMLDDAG